MTQRRLPPPDDDGQMPPPLVPFIPYRCPHCGRYKPDTYATRGRMRYHRCGFCHRRYRSWEISAESIGDTWIPPPQDLDDPPGG